MNVVFWSYLPGVSSVSSSMLAMSLSTTIKHKIKCSVMQLQYSHNYLQEYLIDSRDNTEDSYFQNMGIDYLMRAAHSNTANEENVNDFSLSFIDQYFNYFPRTSAVDERVYKNDLTESSEEMFKVLNDGFKLNFIDVPAGVNHYSKIAMANADVIVVCLPQSKPIIDAYFNEIDLARDKTFYLFTEYDPKQKLLLSNICKQHKATISEKNCGVVPYNTRYGDALSTHHAISFYYQNLKCKMSDPNYSFISKVNASAGKLIKLCGLTGMEE